MGTSEASPEGWIYEVSAGISEISPEAQAVEVSAGTSHTSPETQDDSNFSPIALCT